MAEFSKGDRVVKMSGNWAGRYGTVNSVGESGTLNVTFDGERLPKYCDPALCGKVAANASLGDFSPGMKVRISRVQGADVNPKKAEWVGREGIVRKTIKSRGLVAVDYPGHGLYESCPENLEIVNFSAANAKFKVGDVVTAYGFPGKCRIVQDDGRYNPANDGWYGLKPLKGGAVFGAHERDIKAANAAEGELRALTEKAKEWAESARAQGDAKTVSNIARGLSLLKDAEAMNANAVSNASYRNSHNYFVIAPGIKDHCILSGWDNREDAEYAAADLRKRGVGCSVARRQLLEMSGVDPDVEKSWKGNHVPNAAANSVARNGRLASMLDSAIAKMNEAEKHKDDPGKVQVAARATEKLVDGVIDGIDAFERTDVDAWHDMYDWLDKSARALSGLAFWPVNIGNRVKTTIRYLGAARRMVAKYNA